MKITQIQRLIPEITLDRVCSPQTLLPALTNDVLTKTATLFGVQRAWPDGVDDRMYRYRGCYKNPKAFFDEIASLVSPEELFPLRANCLKTKLDQSSGKHQPLVMVFAKRLPTGATTGNCFATAF